MELRLLLAAIRRGALVLVLALAMGLALGYAGYKALPRHYSASATLLIDSGAVLDFWNSNLTHEKRIVLNGGELRQSGSAAVTTVLGASQNLVLAADSYINVGRGDGTPGGKSTNTHLNVLSKITGSGDLQ